MPLRFTKIARGAIDVGEKPDEAVEAPDEAAEAPGEATTERVGRRFERAGPRPERVPPRHRPPAPERERSRRSLLVSILGSTAILVLAGGAIVWLATLVSEEPDERDATTALSVPGAADLTVPGDWADAPGPGLPGFGRDARAVMPDRSQGSFLVAGTVRAGSTSLLPDGIARQLAGPEPRPSIHERGGTWVFGYRDLALRDPAGRVSIDLLPTARGVEAVACFVSVRDRSGFASRCRQVAAELRTADGVRPYPGASRPYATELRRSIGALSAARTTARKRLARSRTPRAEARLADRLAGDYARAAARVRGGDEVERRPELSATNERIAGALRRAGAAYAALSSAARRSDSRDFARARRTVRQRESDVQRALADLAGFGYRPSRLR